MGAGSWWLVRRGRLRGFSFLYFAFCVWWLWLAGVPVAHAAASPPIVINELNYHPASDVAGEEYIELYNAGAVSVTMAGWRMSDGVDYAFPTGTVLLPGAYLVVAGDPAVLAAVYGITPTLGPFTGGKLSNSGERVALADEMGVVVDVVVYDDHAPWPESTDGEGASLELVNPLFNNESSCAWAASVVTVAVPLGTPIGTPGAQNSVYLEGNIPPCIIGTTHTPVTPLAREAVTVTALVDDVGPVGSGVVAVTVHYRVQGAGDYTSVGMTLLPGRGLASPVEANAGQYVAVLSGLSISETIFPLPGQGVYVEFYITATDDAGATRVVPAGAPSGVSPETGLPTTVSYLYWVEDVRPVDNGLPQYRVFITDENRAELETRDVFSNELLDATFVYSDTVYYNVGVRYRGESSRDMFPRPYRIKFNDAQEFESRERINLNSDEIGREMLAYDLFQRAGLLGSDARFVTLYLNGHPEGVYVDVEQVDRDFLKAHLGDDDDGNLYRGIDNADLVYRPGDWAYYVAQYRKVTNVDAADYTDIISLTQTLSTTPDEDFVAEVDKVADMRQWLKWFAVQAVLDNHEGALWLGPGDDYFIYRRGVDDRFVLISWDHDSTFIEPEHTIWEPDWYARETVRRILHTPLFTRWYYQGIAELITGPFAVAEMVPRIDALSAVAVSAGDKQELRDFVTVRVPYLWTQIPGDRLHIVTNGGQDIVTTDATVALEGTCSPLRDVTVNGSAAGVSYVTAVSWRYTAPLPTRDNVFVISDGADTQSLTVFRDLFHGGTLTASTVLTGSALPYRIQQDIVLAGDITLTVVAGATLVFEPGRMMRVEDGARLWIRGTKSAPVVLTGQAGQFWGGVLLWNTQQDNRIEFAVLEYIYEFLATPRTHGVSAYNAHITISDSVLRHMRHSTAVTAAYDSVLYLLRNEIYDIGTDAVHATGGYAYIQGNVIRDSFYDLSFNPSPPEGIEISHMEGDPAVLLDNRIYNITDDCLDVNYSSVIVERNIMHHCGDKGISVGHPSSSTIVNNLVYACWGNPDDPNRTGFGIALKDGAVATLAHNTLVANRHGLGLFEMHAGEGGGAAVMRNSIVWGNGTQVVVRDGSTFSMTYSNVAGGWEGEGNSAADPLFRRSQYADYRLQAVSPCVDTALADVAALDVRGWGRPQGAGYDRGAFVFMAY